MTLKSLVHVKKFSRELAVGVYPYYSLLSRFSEECLHNRETIRQGDALYIMGRSIAQTKLGAEVSLDFMIANWEKIIAT